MKMISKSQSKHDFIYKQQSATCFGYTYSSWGWTQS